MLIFMNDYERIAKIIEYIGSNFREQPDLEHLAKVAGISSYHFHRLFRRWARTTPKSFVQYLTALEAGKLLRHGNPVLETALDVGLSGPGRLHDLCVNLEAASPGEIRSGGEGWKIRAGFCSTPFGEALIGTSPRGVCKLSFITTPEDRESEWQKLLNLWPKASCERDDQEAEKISRSIFVEQQRHDCGEPLKLFVKGTAFQTKVWRALVEIPAGETQSYGNIAKMIGSPKASRAVGSAVGSNPLAYVIPCHRVICSNGTVGDYHWGADRKRAALVWDHSLRHSELNLCES